MNKDEWKVDGNFDEIVKTYSGIADSPCEDVIERRKKLVGALRNNLLVENQSDLVDYFAKNLGRIHMFELGGTFKSVVNNFLPIVYADVLTEEIKNNGMPALNFVVIDPSDVSRIQRIFIFGGSKYKIPLPLEKVAEGRTTSVIAPPKPHDLATLFDEMKRETTLYFDAVFKENHGFRASVDEKLKCRGMLRTIEARIESFKDATFKLAEESKTFRDFTDGLYSYMIGGFLKNSVCVTLKQWQAGWNLDSLLTNSGFYATLEKFGESKKVEASDYKFSADMNERLTERLASMNAYTVPFRVDREGWSFQDPVFDLNKKEFWIQAMELGKPEPLILNPEEFLGENTTLLPRGGTLYALDALMYNATSIANLDEKAQNSYLLAKALGSNPKPLVPKIKLEYFSIGRKTKSEPEEKPSGLVAAVIEVDGRERLSNLVRSSGNVFSPAYEKYKQPTA